MEERVIEKVEEPIKQILDQGVDLNNVEYLYKLSKIKHMAKEDKEMNMEYRNYGNYGGRQPGYDSYGRYYGNYSNYNERAYGRQGRDIKYRGDDYMDRMSNEYGRYMESRERYGAGEETDKAFHFMTKALGEYVEFLFEEAQTPQQKQELMQTLQSLMR